MALFIGETVVSLSLVNILLHAPALLIELTDTIVSVWQATALIQFKGALQVFRITLTSFAENVGKVTLRQVIALVYCTLIPVDCFVDVFLDYDAILENGTDVILYIRFLQVWVIGMILQQV